MNDPLFYDPARRVLLDQNGLTFARDIGAADAIRVTEALSICADLPSVLRDTLATHVYDADNFETIPDDDPLKCFARRAENVTADEPEGTPPAPEAETLSAVLDDLLAYEAEAFEDDGEVNGGDLVEAFGAIRVRLKAALATRPAVFAPAPIGLLEIAEALSDATEALDKQLDQVCQLHRYSDDDTRGAMDEGDEVRKRLDLYRKATADGPAQVIVAVSGGVITDVGFSRDCPGLEVITVDYDVEGETDPEAVEMIDQSASGEEPDWQAAYVCRYRTDDDLPLAGAKPRTLAPMRPATAEDLA